MRQVRFRYSEEAEGAATAAAACSACWCWLFADILATKLLAPGLRASGEFSSSQPLTSLMIFGFLVFCFCVSVVVVFFFPFSLGVARKVANNKKGNSPASESECERAALMASKQARRQLTERHVLRVARTNFEWGRSGVSSAHEVPFSRLTYRHRIGTRFGFRFGFRASTDCHTVLPVSSTERNVRQGECHTIASTCSHLIRTKG